MPVEHEEVEEASPGLKKQLNGMGKDEKIAAKQAAGKLKMSSSEADTEDNDLEELKSADSSCPDEMLDESD